MWSMFVKIDYIVVVIEESEDIPIMPMGRLMAYCALTSNKWVKKSHAQILNKLYKAEWLTIIMEATQVVEAIMLANENMDRDEVGIDILIPYKKEN